MIKHPQRSAWWFDWMSLIHINLIEIIAIIFVLLPVAAAGEVVPFTVPNAVTHKITSATLNRSYSVYVKTPLGYDDAENATRHYPVIYLNDGPYTFPVASGVTHLPMGRSNKFKRAILVGISYAAGENGMHSRVRDLTPISDASWKKYETGGAPAYFKFIQNELLPMVETKYRIDPTQRMLTGQSLGGSFGTWVMFEHPGVFSSYLLTSPSLWYKNRSIFDSERKYALKNNDLHAKVYFAVGEKETIANGMQHPMVPQLAEFVKVLNSRQYPNLEVKVEVISGAIHETTFPQGFTRGIHWLLGQN